MLQLKISFIFLLFFCSSAILGLPAQAAWVGSQSVTFALSPTTATHNVGDSFTLTININTGGKNVIAAEAIVNWNASNFELTAWSTNNSVFNTGNNCTYNNKPCEIIDVSASGKADIIKIKPSPGVSTLNGIFATLTFKALKTTDPQDAAIQPDNITFSFTSAGASGDSDIIQDADNVPDLLAGVNNARITVRQLKNSPADPSSLSATAASSSQINLSWRDNSNNETEFQIERKTGNGAFTQIARVSAGTKKYTDTNLSSGTIYIYRIRATNNTGNSSYSNEASGTTKSIPIPAPPAGKVYPNNTLLKTSSNPDVYVIKDNKRELISNWRSFVSFGYQLNKVQIISQEEMNKIGLIDLIKLDSDNDKLTNAQERQYGTDAAKADTDGDGYNDYEEISTGHDPLVPAGVKPLPIFVYSKPRLRSLADEQERARILRSELEKKYTKEQLKGLSVKNWITVVNSYIYGGYPMEAIVKALKYSGKTVHPTIPWSVWKNSKDYSNYINR